MAPRITHSKVSTKPNPSDSSKVGGADWNAEHVIEGLTIGSDVQAYDPTLAAWAAFNSNGILAQVSQDQFTSRTLTGTANEITVTNGSGVSGNPTFSLPDALTFTSKTITGGTFNDILSMTAHTAGATPSTIADTGRLAKFYDGSSGTPVASVAPSVSISRYDTSNLTAGVYPSALFVETIGDNTSSAHGVSPLNAATFRATQNGHGDVLGVGVEVTGNGGDSYYAYGYFYNVWAAVSAQAAFGIEGIVTNDSASVPYIAGATNVYYAQLNLGSAGSHDVTAGIHLWGGVWGSRHDVGLLGGIGSITSALVWDDSSGVTSYKDTGTHTDGIDLTGATYSGSAIKSTGFSVSPTGIVAAATGSTVNGVAIVNLSATQTLTNKSMDGGSNTFTNIPGTAITGAALTKTDDTNVTLTLGGTPATALNRAASITVGWTGTLAASRGGTGISSLGTGVATALGTNVGSAGAFVTFGGALGSPSSVGTLPAHTLGGTISGGGNQINNVIIGSSTPLAGAFTTLAATDITASGFVQAASSSGFKLGSVVILDIATNYIRIKAPDGSQALSFGNSADPNAYFDDDQSIFRSRNTASTWATIDTNGVNIQTGNLRRAGTQVVGARDTGWTAMTGTANKNTAYDTSTVTLAQLAGRVMSLQAALTTHGLIGA